MDGVEEYDPNFSLQDIRAGIEVIENGKDDLRIAANADHLAELVKAMDEHLADGGDLPDDWARRR